MNGRVIGVLLAAGAGRRYGTPKGLLTDPDGTPWVARSADVLAGGGCDPVLVVVGAEADRVATLVPADHPVVRAEDWVEGMGASLRTGLLAALAAAGADPPRPAVAAMIGLVDTPGVVVPVTRRLVAIAEPGVLARAAYRGELGHPVLIGREHWPGLIESAGGDRGARDYLAGRDVTLVECGDVGDGRDIDSPADADSPGDA